MALIKTKQYFQAYKEYYSKDFPSIKASREGEKFAFCEICWSDFSISHGGKFDVSRHLKTFKHLEYAKSSSTCRKLDNFLKNDAQLNIVKAELLFTSSLVEHNVSLLAADHKCQMKL